MEASRSSVVEPEERPSRIHELVGSAGHVWAAVDGLGDLDDLESRAVPEPQGQLFAADEVAFLSGFESTYMPTHGLDSLNATGHSANWRTDLAALRAAGVTLVRYPLRWHVIETAAGKFSWEETDAVFEHMDQLGIVPIVDLIHHTSYPRWLTGGFADQRFGTAFVDYAGRVSTRYPNIRGYTVFNEPFATLFLAGHESLWPPYGSGMQDFVRLVTNVLPAIGEAAFILRRNLPRAEHVWIDTAEAHSGDGGSHSEYAELANDRRHFLLDVFLGRDMDDRRPFVREFRAAGGFSMPPLPENTVDILGLDYYPHSEWFYDDAGAHAPSSRPVGFAAIAEHYGNRYGLPMFLAETNIRGMPSDRASWLKHMLEQCELARSRGVDLRGLCWFPYVDSADWDSLLARRAGRVDPVGVLSRRPDGVRVRTVFTEVWERAVQGAVSSDLPAYRWQSPCSHQLAGLTPLMRHWPVVDPDPSHISPPVTITTSSLTRKRQT